MSPDRPPSLPPAPVLEAELARDWERLLGLPAVARDDDFWKLGGESMAAVELLALLERRYGVVLAIDALVPGLTVAGLARRLARAEAGAAACRRSPLVPLQPAGTRPPLVCVHPSGGSILCYLDLARQLGAKQPFYGLQGPDPRAGDEPHLSIESMAAAYLAALRDTWPGGPYRLSGYSFGGYVAFEMARQLVAAGGEPPFVALLDTRAPAGVRPRGNGQPEGGLVAELAAVLERHILEEEPTSPSEERRLWDDLADLAGRHLESAPHPPRRPSRMGAIQRFFREHRLLPAGDEIGYADVRRYLRILRANLRCSRAYAPAPYPGRVVLFQAAERLTAAEAPPDDHAAGWSALATGGLEVRRVPGHHLSLLAPPAVDALARELAVCLARP